MIQTVEVICKPCSKCQDLEKQIKDAIHTIEGLYKIKIPYTFQMIRDLGAMSKFSLTSYQSPVIVINGQVEMAGRVDIQILRKRLEAIHKMG